MNQQDQLFTDVVNAAEALSAAVRAETNYLKNTRLDSVAQADKLVPFTNTVIECTEAMDKALAAFGGAE